MWKYFPFKRLPYLLGLRNPILKASKIRKRIFRNYYVVNVGMFRKSKWKFCKYDRIPLKSFLIYGPYFKFTARRISRRMSVDESIIFKKMTNES